MVFLAWLGVVLPGCVASIPAPERDRPLPVEQPVRTGEGESPRALASLELTEEGRILVEHGNPDDAIRVLERAVGLNPSNGQNYFYLAEAWLMKGNIGQAEEFNRLAGTCLERDPDWSLRVMRQRERIKRGSL